MFIAVDRSCFRAIVALGLAILAISTASAAPLPNCRGPGCADLDLAGCIIKNNSDKPIELFIELKSGGVAGMATGDEALPPGTAQDLSTNEGKCVFPERAKGYVAHHVTKPGPGVKLVKPEDVFGIRKVTCTGDACAQVSLVEHAGCVWLQSGSDKPVTASVTIGSETLNLPLEAVDAEKAAASEQLAECARVPNADKLREEGIQVPPEFEARHQACKALKVAEQAQQVSGAQVTGHHANKYVPLTGGKRPVFSIKLAPASGCVKQVTDIAAYTANYGATNTAAKLADGPAVACKLAVGVPCAGDACGAVCVEDAGLGACREGLTNGGNRAVEIMAHFKDNALSAVKQPGEFFSFSTPMGCAPLADLSRIEANYR